MSARHILTTVMLLGLLWCPLCGWADARLRQGIVLFGIGEQPCSEWTSAVTDHKDIPMGSMPLRIFIPAVSYMQWLFGFLTAISSTVPGASDLRDPSKVCPIFDKMNSYCKNLPSGEIGLAAITIIDECYFPATPQ